jgi:hypothetical protein
MRGSSRSQRYGENHSASLHYGPDPAAIRRHPLAGQGHHGPKAFYDCQHGHRLCAARTAPFPSLSVDEHLTLTYRKTALASAWTPQRVYDLFPELADRRKLSGTRLSGGEQQMLAIGRALGVTAKKVEVKVDCGRRKLGLLILAWALMRWPRARSYPRAYPTE